MDFKEKNLARTRRNMQNTLRRGGLCWAACFDNSFFARFCWHPLTTTRHECENSRTWPIRLDCGTATPRHEYDPKTRQRRFELLTCRDAMHRRVSWKEQLSSGLRKGAKRVFRAWPANVAGFARRKTRFPPPCQLVGVCGEKRGNLQTDRRLRTAASGGTKAEGERDETRKDCVGRGTSGCQPV